MLGSESPVQGWRYTGCQCALHPHLAPGNTFDIAFCFLNSKKFSILSILLNLLKLPSHPVVNAHGYHVIWSHVSCYCDCKFCIFTHYINYHIALHSIQMLFKFLYSICLISFRTQWWEKYLFVWFFFFLQISHGFYWHRCYFILNTAIKLLICLLYILKGMLEISLIIYVLNRILKLLCSVSHTL